MWIRSYEQTLFPEFPWTIAFVDQPAKHVTISSPLDGGEAIFLFQPVDFFETCTVDELRRVSGDEHLAATTCIVAELFH